MKIFVANNPPQAHIVCELLQTQNIAAEVRGEGLFGLQGELPMDETTQPYVWLLEPSRSSDAQIIIDQYLDETNRVMEWSCPHCKEVNEGQFGVCWQCGSSRPN